MYLTYKKIRLSKFLGMWLNNIGMFEFEIKESINLILGRNGSGKSRLMSQLSPLAPSKTDFSEGGFKELTCEHSGTTYLLTCTYTGKALKCSFLNVDTGEYMCENANPSVYNKFVKDIFKYDKDLHELFTGQVKLTEMKTPERRKWFSLLSESDLTYALNFYKKSREHNRDISGVIKSLKRTIGELRPQVLENEDDREALKLRVGVLQDDISKVEQLLTPITKDRSVNDTTLDNELNTLENLSKEIIKLQTWLPTDHEKYNSRELESKLSYLTAASEGQLAKLADLEKRISKANDVNSVDVNELQGQVDNLTTFVAEESKLMFAFPTLLDCDLNALCHALEDSSNFCNTLTESMSALTTDHPVDDPKARLDAFRAEAGKCQAYKQKLVNHDATLVADLKHMSNVCEVTCPKCSTDFKPGVSDVEIERAKARSLEVFDLLTAQDAKLKALEENIELYTTFAVAANNIALTARPAVSVLFDALKAKNAFTDSPSMHLGLINQYQTELARAVQIVNAKQSIVSITNELTLALATQAEDTGMLKSMHSATELAISEIRKDEDLYNSMLNTANQMEYVATAMESYNTRLDMQARKVNQVSDIMSVNMKYDALQDHKAMLWELLTVAKVRYDDMEASRIKLQYQEDELATYERRFEASKKLVKSMSPDEGILAKYIYEGITRITDLMTGYINHIWGYEMKILPCAIDGGEMDYKFPFWAKDKSRPNADVSHGSSAQKEVIDFVFVLAVYRALDLASYPLLIDETLAAFDTGHRDEAINFIKDLIGKQHHSQCFMISHDATTHFKLTHADLIVLDNDGIEGPASFNKNVLIS